MCCGYSPPTGNPSSLRWFPSGQPQRYDNSSREVGTEEELYLTFEVEDTGKGISGDEMSLLFNRFSQANPRTHVQVSGHPTVAAKLTLQKYGGSGLGLFISRELTELQGGLIGASSVPDVGSTYPRAFTVHVEAEAKASNAGTFAFHIRTRKVAPVEGAHSPLQHAASTNGRKPPASVRETFQAAENPKPTVKATSSQSPSTLIRPSPITAVASEGRSDMPSVILVEDNLINQKVLSKQLQKLGCAVHIANHGLEALDLLKKSRYWQENHGAGFDVDVILMDWEMPVMDGLTATKEIRQMEQEGLVTEHLRVIATTANARPEQIQMAFAAGVVSLHLAQMC